MKLQSQKEKAPAYQPEVLIKRFCHDCKITETPMWRVGPSGPKSLCNACGIRFGKKSRRDSSKKNEISIKKTQNIRKIGCVEVDGEEKKERKDLKVGLRGLGKEMLLLKKQRSSSMRRKQRKMGEMEEAALLLMSLSCGSVSVSLPKQTKI